MNLNQLRVMYRSTFALLLLVAYLACQVNLCQAHFEKITKFNISDWEGTLRKIGQYGTAYTKTRNGDHVKIFCICDKEIKPNSKSWMNLYDFGQKVKDEHTWYIGVTK